MYTFICIYRCKVPKLKKLFACKFVVKITNVIQIAGKKLKGNFRQKSND